MPNTSPPSTQQTISRHIGVIDGFRGIAILGVFLVHAFVSAYQTPLPWAGSWKDFCAAPSKGFITFYFFTLGVFGVPLFFVLSGFSIHYSTLRSGFNTFQFFWRRFWRIYPGYLAALVFFCWWHRIPFLSWQFVTHLLLVHNLFSDTFFGVNASFWSLATECQLYLLYPLVLLLMKRLGLRGAFIAIAGLSLAYRLPMSIYLAANPELSFEFRRLCWNFPAATWLDWLLGAYIAEAYINGYKLFPRRNTLLLVCFSLATIVSSQSWPLEPWSPLFASLFFAVLVERAIHSPPGVLSTRVICAIGTWSYSFYLWHQPFVGYWANIIIRRLHLTDIGPTKFLMLMVATLPIFVIASGILYHVLEKPFFLIGKMIGVRKLNSPPGGK